MEWLAVSPRFHRGGIDPPMYVDDARHVRKTFRCSGVIILRRNNEDRTTEESLDLRKGLDNTSK